MNDEPKTQAQLMAELEQLRQRVAELEAGILAAVDDFSRGAYQNDDITLLIIRYTGRTN